MNGNETRRKRDLHVAESNTFERHRETQPLDPIETEIQDCGIPDPCGRNILDHNSHLGVESPWDIPWGTSPRGTSLWGTSPRSPSPSGTPCESTSCGTSPCTDATQSSTIHSSQLPLVGREDDILVPTVGQINGTFTAGQRMWTSYVSSAERYSPSSLPPCCLQPSIVLKDIPQLPEDIRGKRSISGHALWNIPCPELANADVGSSDGVASTDDEPWRPEHVFGAQKTFSLWIKKPVVCGISPESAFDKDRLPGPNGLAILTLCWSYIFSVRLLEMQHRRIQYSAIMSPILTCNSGLQKKDVILSLGHSSKKLVRWLCAVLAPGVGWLAKGSVPPWTAHCNQDVQFIISTELSTNEFVQEKPPSFVEAVDLILELCALYDFSSQPTEAFLAALLFPFHATQDLQPRLPLPQIPPLTEVSHKAPEYIRDYANDIRYYMTLSVSARVIGSAIWSIFWEPGIHSNVASAWLGSIYNVLQPLLEAANMELLAKVLAIRNPRLAPLWLGFLRCGSSQVLDMIGRYLTTHHEHSPGWSLGYPDLDVAAWTGSKQSFLHEECSRIYKDHDIFVSTADVLRHRFNFRLAEKDTFYFGWQPFGTIKMEQIEPELWPRLESPSPLRQYTQWVWWLDKIKVNECYVHKTTIEKGFSHDKRASSRGAVKSTNESLSLGHMKNDIIHTTPTALPAQPPNRAVPIKSFKQGPSKQATLHILRMGSWEATGDRTLDSMGIPEVRKHEWLRGEREM
ncbi:hypothetical protein G7Y89_g1863 [Cudoniella acicularis]|uniref:Uncharacterized protein n=1 Tax=Cudoniella acicularis TaxID=354080 RepID=A0A8H4W705_9HELO|nr:hypothetical protein G7Y89_g1863 [Cudoniella acicularis]